MSVEPPDESTRGALRAMRRAARKVMARAVRDNDPIPLWDGEKVVWKVPKEELAELLQVEAAEAADQPGDAP